MPYEVYDANQTKHRQTGAGRAAMMKMFCDSCGKEVQSNERIKRGKGQGLGELVAKWRESEKAKYNEKGEYTGGDECDLAASCATLDCADQLAAALRLAGAQQGGGGE